MIVTLACIALLAVALAAALWIAWQRTKELAKSQLLVLPFKSHIEQHVLNWAMQSISDYRCHRPI